MLLLLLVVSEVLQFLALVLLGVSCSVVTGGAAGSGAVTSTAAAWGS
jgi:hypothetical protein